MATSVALGTDSLVDPPALGWIAAAPGSAVPHATGALGERRYLNRAVARGPSSTAAR